MMRPAVITALLFIAAAVATAAPARGQSLDAFRERLAKPASAAEAAGAPGASGQARVVVTEYGDAQRIVADASRSTARLRVRGYRVCVFFDNGQDARAMAAAAKALFEEQFPGIRVNMVWDNPYFRVTAGNCLNLEEAIILKERVAGTFPKAYPKSEELSITDFLN